MKLLEKMKIIKNNEKNEIKQNQINNDEIIEFEKKSKKKIMN